MNLKEHKKPFVPDPDIDKIYEEMLAYYRARESEETLLPVGVQTKSVEETPLPIDTQIRSAPTRPVRQHSHSLSERLKNFQTPEQGPTQTPSESPRRKLTGSLHRIASSPVESPRHSLPNPLTDPVRVESPRREASGGGVANCERTRRALAKVAQAYENNKK